MNMACIREEYPVAQKLIYILSFLSPRCIPKTIINPGSPELEDKDLVEFFSDDFDVNDIQFSIASCIESFKSAL